MAYFRDARDWADGRPGARTGDDPQLPHRAGPVLGASTSSSPSCSSASCSPIRGPLLTLIVLGRNPVLRADRLFGVRPPLRAAWSTRNSIAAPQSQQFLVESGGRHRTQSRRHGGRADDARRSGKRSSPPMWKTSFRRRRCSATGGQLAMQYVSKLTTAALLLFGAKAVIDGEPHRRRARRLQHDRLRRPGAADPVAPVADLAGLSAGADLDRAAGRHPQHSARILRRLARLAAAGAARRDRISPASASATVLAAPEVSERHFA